MKSKLVLVMMVLSMFAFADTIKVDTMKIVKVDSIQVATQVNESVNETVASYFLNGIEINFFFVLFVFMLLGSLLNILFDISERDKLSSRTPVKFNIIFLLKDNIIRFFIALLLIYFAIIFSKDIFGVEMTIKLAVCIGYSLDNVALLIKNKFKIKEPINPTT